MEIGSTEGAPFALSSMFDRAYHPARGRGGGRPGATGRVSLSSGEELPPKGRTSVSSGERVILEMPGGGGRGKPEERDTSMIQEDLKNGFISVEKARSEYGVTVSNSDSLVARKD